MALIVEIKVVPGSGNPRCILDKSGMLKCYLKNPPEKGKANQELIKLIAKAVGVPNDKVAIVTGLASRSKRLKIEQNLTFDALLECLGIQRQITLF